MTNPLPAFDNPDVTAVILADACRGVYKAQHVAELFHFEDFGDLSREDYDILLKGPLDEENEFYVEAWDALTTTAYIKAGPDGDLKVCLAETEHGDIWAVAPSRLKAPQDCDSVFSDWVPECCDLEEDREESIRDLARKKFPDETQVQIDPVAVVSEGDDNGAWVAAWVWVDFTGTQHDKTED